MRVAFTRILCECISRQIWTHPPSNTTSFSTSGASQKNRKIFYNKYIEQIRRKKRVYTGYAEDILKDQRERIESKYEDYEEELIAEGKKRQRAYVHSRRMRNVQKGPGPRLLTFQQMDQIRFLQQTDPDEWDIQSLAHSFQVPELVIRKVLKNRAIPKPETQEKLDNKARAKRRISHSSSDTSNRVESSLTITEDNPPLAKDKWGLPEWQNLGWFSGYEKTAMPHNTKGNQRHKKSSEVQWLDEEECEFYEDLYQSMEKVEEIGDDADDKSENHPVNVRTDDGITFYSEDGELIYKI